MGLVPSEVNGAARAKLISSNQIELTVHNGGYPYTTQTEHTCIVIEFENVKSLQRGTTPAGSSGTATVAVSPVDVNKSLIFASYSSPVVNAYFGIGKLSYKLLDEDSLWLSGGSGGSGWIFEWQLVEFM